MESGLTTIEFIRLHVHGELLVCTCIHEFVLLEDCKFNQCLKEMIKCVKQKKALENFIVHINMVHASPS